MTRKRVVRGGRGLEGEGGTDANMQNTYMKINKISVLCYASGFCILLFLGQLFMIII